MVIPFQSITSFNDPSVGFGLQFGKADESCDDEERTMSDAGPNVISNKNSDPDNQYGDEQDTRAVDAPTRLQQRDTSTRQMTEDGNNSADVVSLDTFRKKPT